MARVPELEDILNEKFESPAVKSKTLVSRSGMHIAGKVPSTAHLETYVAMSAIIHGAADPIASELGDKLKFIRIDMEGSQLILLGLAGKAILAIHATKEFKPEEALKRGQDLLDADIERHL